MLCIACGALAQAADGSLLEAAYTGDPKQVAALIKAGADVNAANQFGATPMSEAARRGDTQVLRLLLKAGASPESANAEGETALMAVARTGNIEAAKLLLKAGAKVDAREKWGGQTALIWASAQNQPAMIKLLAAKGAEVDARSAVRDWERRMTAEERPKDLNRGGMSALMFAARDGSMDAVRALLAAGAKVDFTDPDGSTPLLVSLMNGHWDVAKLLIESGADVNQWDWWGQSPLYMAVDMNTLPVGARIELPTMDHTTGMEIINLLLAKGANPNVQLKLRPAVPERRPGPLGRSSHRLRRDPAAACRQGCGPAGHAGIAGRRCRGRLPNIYGHTPLIVVAGATRGRATPTRGGNYTEAQAIDAVKLLLAAGANVNAAAYGNGGQLVSRGAAPALHWLRGSRGLLQGESAMHGAALRSWMQLAEVLKQAGADLDPMDADGKTPLDYAMGRYRLGFLENAPEPQLKIAAALRALGAKRKTRMRPPCRRAHVRWSLPRCPSSLSERGLRPGWFPGHLFARSWRGALCCLALLLRGRLRFSLPSRRPVSAASAVRSRCVARADALWQRALLVQLDGPPQVPGARRAIGLPSFRVGQQCLGFGQSLQAIRQPETVAHAEVVGGHHVVPAEVEHQQHLHGPAAMPRTATQRSMMASSSSRRSSSSGGRRPSAACAARSCSAATLAKEKPTARKDSGVAAASSTGVGKRPPNNATSRSRIFRPPGPRSAGWRWSWPALRTPIHVRTCRDRRSAIPKQSCRSRDPLFRNVYATGLSWRSLHFWQLAQKYVDLWPCTR